MNFVGFLGRILFSLLFLVKGFEHFSSDAIGREGFPPLLMIGSGIFLLAGGLSLLLGYQAKIGAWALALFLFPVTFLMHRFWVAVDPFASLMHEYCFWKNISLIGACLMLAKTGPGPFSLDSIRTKKKR